MHSHGGSSRRQPWRAWAVAVLLVLALAGEVHAASDDIAGCAMPVDTGAPTRAAAARCALAVPQDIIDALQPIEQALAATGAWPVLRQSAGSAAVDELRFWRLAGAHILGVALRRHAGVVELQRLRIERCMPWRPSPAEPQDSAMRTWRHCRSDPPQDGRAWQRDDTAELYRVDAARSAGSERGPRLEPLWQALQAELVPALLHPGDCCSRSGDGTRLCTLQHGEVLDLLEWSASGRYLALVPDPGDCPGRDHHHHRLLAALHAHLGADSGFAPLHDLVPRSTATADCSACPGMDAEACASRVQRARQDAAALLPDDASAPGVLTCSAEHFTVSFPIAAERLPRPAMAGAPPYPGARHHAHVRYRRSDGELVVVLGE